MELTRENIVALLERNDKAVGRALLVLLRNQTFDEQQSEDTKHQNGKGFASCDAFVGTRAARQFQERGYLSPKQVAYWRIKDARGNSRIGKYWKQLVKAAEERKAA